MAAEASGAGHVRSLDGLRALAVGAVMATHADLPFAAGGEMGVDVFFVLSGFLITRLLQREHAALGSIGFGAFYARRALRLLPALLVVVAATLLVVAAGGRFDFTAISAGREPVGGLMANTVGEVLLATFYLADVSALFGVTDVFLGHTWSLAVEEQFYLVWPLLFGLVIVRLAPRHRPVVVAAGALALTAVRVGGVIGPAGILQLRVDALLIGVTTALALDQWAVVRRSVAWWPLAALVLGGALVVGPQGLDTVAGRSVYTAAALASAVVITACWTGGIGVGARVLTLAPLVYLGQISYGLYLWHLPVFRRIALADLSLPSAAIVLLKLATTLGLAAVCFAVVERPALRLKARFAREAPPPPLVDGPGAGSTVRPADRRAGGH